MSHRNRTNLRMPAMKSFDGFQQTVFADQILTEARIKKLDLSELSLKELRGFKSYQSFRHHGSWKMKKRPFSEMPATNSISSLPMYNRYRRCSKFIADAEITGTSRQNSARNVSISNKTSKTWNGFDQRHLKDMSIWGKRRTSNNSIRSQKSEKGDHVNFNVSPKKVYKSILKSSKKQPAPVLPAVEMKKVPEIQIDSDDEDFVNSNWTEQNSLQNKNDILPQKKDQPTTTLQIKQPKQSKKHSFNRSDPTRLSKSLRMNYHGHYTHRRSSLIRGLSIKYSDEEKCANSDGGGASSYVESFRGGADGSLQNLNEEIHDECYYEYGMNKDGDGDYDYDEYKNYSDENKYGAYD